MQRIRIGSFNHQQAVSILIGAALVASTGSVGCESLPGNEESQGAVIGGVGGAVAGALIGGEDNRLLGALIGGAAGAGGGYLIGANWDKITGEEKDEAERAVSEARENPATAAQAQRATTADVNRDGFVTQDEIIAMEKAGFTDSEIIRRLEATNQYFELTTSQEAELRDAGLDEDVIVAMRQMQGPPEAREDIAARKVRAREDAARADIRDD